MTLQSDNLPILVKKSHYEMLDCKFSSCRYLDALIGGVITFKFYIEELFT